MAISASASNPLELEGHRPYLMRFALLQLFRFPAPFGELMTYVVLPQALYNGFLGAALVFALAWSDALKERPS